MPLSPRGNRRRSLARGNLTWATSYAPGARHPTCATFSRSTGDGDTYEKGAAAALRHPGSPWLRPGVLGAADSMRKLSTTSGVVQNETLVHERGGRRVAVTVGT